MVKYIVEDGLSRIRKTGIGQYTILIEKILSNLNIATSEIKKTTIEKIKNKVLRRITYCIWLNTLFLLKLLLIKEDVVVIFTNYAIPLIKLPHVKYIPVIHDLSPIKYPNCTTKTINVYEKNNIYNAIRNGDIIITVSDTVKKEILETFNIDKDKVVVVYNTVSDIFNDNKNNDNSILKKYNLEPYKYILSVATLNRRKNIPMLIDAFKKIKEKYPDLKLVLVGGMGSENKTKLNASENIIFTGYLEDDFIPIFYKNALLYVFPSIYEGFGIPIIEAQSSGVSVLCSDIPVFREVADESAEYAKVTIQDFVQKIEQLINDDNRRNELIHAGKQNIKRFAQEKISSQINDIMELING